LTIHFQIFFELAKFGFSLKSSRFADAVASITIFAFVAVRLPQSGHCCQYDAVRIFFLSLHDLAGGSGSQIFV